MEQVAPTLAALTAELHALRDELIDAVQPIEQRVVALAAAVDRVQESTERAALPVPAARTPERSAADAGAEAGAGAALIAAAATAMARVEARLDAEFDALQRELAEVRLLLAPEAQADTHARRLRLLRPRRRSA